MALKTKEKRGSVDPQGLTPASRQAISLGAEARTTEAAGSSARQTATKTLVREDSAQFAAMCEDLLERGLRVRFTANGQSMQPNILSGDHAVVAPASEKELSRGDVVLAQNDH